MDVFKSVFSSKLRCTGCSNKIPPYKKRRKCKVCSILYLENLFCRRCSIKVKHPKLGYLWSKRYCIPCYNLISQETVTASQASSPLRTKRRGLNNCKSMPDITIYNSEHEEIHKPKGLPTNRSVISTQFVARMKCELDIQERNPLEIFTIDKKIGEGSAGSVYYVNRKIDSMNIIR